MAEEKEGLTGIFSFGNFSKLAAILNKMFPAVGSAEIAKLIFIFY